MGRQLDNRPPQSVPSFDYGYQPQTQLAPMQLQSGLPAQNPFADAGTGAALGTMISPGMGTVIGAGIGATTSLLGGLMSARAQKKQQQRQIQSQSLQNIGQIEQESASQRNAALSNILNSLRSAFLG